MNKKTKSFGIVLLALIVLCAPAAAAAIPAPPIPNQFYGTVTIEGSSAADGITVSAWIDGVEYASTTTSDGTYGISSAFIVPAPDDLSTLDKRPVEFYVDGVLAGETAIFESGGVIELGLTASAASASTVTTTSTAATTTSTDGGATGGGGGVSTAITPTPTPTATPTATPTTAMPIPTQTTTSTYTGAPIPPSTPEEIATITPPRTVFGMSTPGFEAAFAVIGLLAVAYLMRGEED